MSYKGIKHGDFSWKSNSCFLGQLSNPNKPRQYTTDPNGLSKEQRARIEEIKNRKTYGDSFDE